MGGILHHLVFGSVSALIVYRNFKRWQYSAAIFIGNFLHDIFIVPFISILLKTFDPMKIISSSYWFHRDTSFLILWMSFQTIFVVFFLFFQKYLRKKEFKDLEYNIGFLLMGILTHAFIDIIVQEQGILY
ncbi:MAG: hypothetical protein QXU74_00230 [Candidatus Aenigmatarchaeota archaeon]